MYHTICTVHNPSTSALSCPDIRKHASASFIWRHEIVIAKLRFTKIKVCKTILLAWKIVVCALCVVASRMYMFVLFELFELPLPPPFHTSRRVACYSCCAFTMEKVSIQNKHAFCIRLLWFSFFLLKFCMKGMKTTLETLKTFNEIDIWTLFFSDWRILYVLWFIEMIGNWN